MRAKTTLKIIFGLILGIIPAVWIAQNDQRVKQKTIRPIIKHLEKKWNAKITIDNCNVNLFTGSIAINNLTIKSLDKVACTWKCQSATLEILPKSSLATSKLALHITLNRNDIYTQYKDKQTGIATLLQAIFSTKPDNFNAKSFKINGCNITIDALDNKIHNFSFQGPLDVQKDDNNLWHAQFCPTDGHLSLGSRAIFTKLSGKIDFDNCGLNPPAVGNITFFAPIIHNKKITISTDNSQNFMSANITDNKFSFNARVSKDKKPTISVKNNKKIELPHDYEIAPKDLWIKSSGTYSIQVKNKHTQRYFKIEGDVEITKSGIKASGTGEIRIPGNYNLITGFSTHAYPNFDEKKITLRDTKINFHKGSLQSQKTTLSFDKNFNLSYFHNDLQAKNLLVNWKNDFFGIIDGNFFLSADGKTKSISGDVIIKKSLMKENIFSQFGGNESKFPLISKENQAINLDLNISNEQALQIKTPFLQTSATTDINIRLNSSPNSLFTPKIGGSIILRRGELTFPRNKLLISSGKISFIPTQINNPIVRLIAKNRIKKYMITLRVNGQIQNPTIFLESNPELTEEQIIALLFAGSENINLQSQLPAIVMQNLSTLILGSTKLSPITTNFFQKLTTPLKYVQITPDFTNQSGRGGVKGTVSIDINKQLHAHLQKNITMQDDLAFQLEYFLSDDFNIKAVKDHRGDIGAEIEFVYK